MGTDSRLQFKDAQLVLIGCVTLGYATVKLLDLVYSNHPTPYIDEVFHIPQAQLYCKNKWTEWNPKITTLPGLYVISYTILKPLEKYYIYTGCTVYGLRLTNVLATIINFVLALLILKQLTPPEKGKHQRYSHFLTAINIATFPPLYFFTFLYYTDVWSLTFVLLMYQQHLNATPSSIIFASIAGSMAVLMRQTNIIWVGLLFIDCAWSAVSDHFAPEKTKDFNHTIGVIKALTTYLPFSKARRRKEDTFLKLVLQVLSKTYPYLIVCFAFVSFTILNDGIVLGDKQAHTAVFHPMQNLYFISFAAFFGLPFILFEIFHARRELPNVFLLALFCGLCAALSESNKLEHPYLLADNRHIAFYVWKRIFGHALVRRLMVPIYVICAFLLYRLMRKCHIIFLAALTFCIILNLTPQHLFELRYFIIPFVMCRFQFNRQTPVMLETIFFTVINFLMINLFSNRPFKWASEPEALQRFIW